MRLWREGWFSPILRWELSAIARRPSYFALRCLHPTLLLVVLLVAGRWNDWENARPGSQAEVAELASSIFVAVAFANFVWIVVATPLAICDAFIRERANGTWDLILVSPLTAGEIVAYKLTSRLIALMSMLLAGAPAMALMLILGGIAPLTVAAVACSSLLLTAFLACVSLYFAADRPTAMGALNSTYSAAGGYLVALPFLAMIIATVASVSAEQLPWPQDQYAAMLIFFLFFVANPLFPVLAATAQVFSIRQSFITLLGMIVSTVLCAIWCGLYIRATRYVLRHPAAPTPAKVARPRRDVVRQFDSETHAELQSLGGCAAVCFVAPLVFSGLLAPYAAIAAALTPGWWMTRNAISVSERGRDILFTTPLHASALIWLAFRSHRAALCWSAAVIILISGVVGLSNASLAVFLLLSSGLMVVMAFACVLAIACSLVGRTVEETRFSWAVGLLWALAPPAVAPPSVAAAGLLPAGLVLGCLAKARFARPPMLLGGTAASAFWVMQGLLVSCWYSTGTPLLAIEFMLRPALTWDLAAPDDKNVLPWALAACSYAVALAVVTVVGYVLLCRWFDVLVDRPHGRPRQRPVEAGA